MFFTKPGFGDLLWHNCKHKLTRERGECCRHSFPELKLFDTSSAWTLAPHMASQAASTLREILVFQRSGPLRVLKTNSPPTSSDDDPSLKRTWISKWLATSSPTSSDFDDLLRHSYKHKLAACKGEGGKGCRQSFPQPKLCETSSAWTLAPPMASQAPSKSKEI